MQHLPSPVPPPRHPHREKMYPVHTNTTPPPLRGGLLFEIGRFVLLTQSFYFLFRLASISILPCVGGHETNHHLGSPLASVKPQS